MLRENNRHFQRATIIGVGLIGGSFGQALRATGAVDEIVGYGRNSAHLLKAVELGLIDRWSGVLSDAVAGADVVLVATPVGAMPELFKGIVDTVSSDCIVTDAGSVKVQVIKTASAIFGSSVGRFVPGHPIAGSERSGVEAATGSLFNDRQVILTPTSDTDPNALSLIADLWKTIGARIMDMTPELHDRLLALTSHLPHMLAYALVNLLADQEQDHGEIFDLAAGGFYDISRIASSDPVMWRDICLNNSDQLLVRISEYREMIDRLAALVRSKDSDGLEGMFRRARNARSRIKVHRKDSNVE